MSAFSEAADRVAKGADPRLEATALVRAMTLEEKLGCLDGDLPFWPGLLSMLGGGYNTRAWPAAAVERLGIPGLHFADGPRGCVVGPATTFPVSMARGASFDRALERRIGRCIGIELRAIGATFTGAVCMNLLRHPAWGRAQETYGEDPHHVGEMALALTGGLQEHVMACMKHFAANSMENARFKVDVRADERVLHEVYLPHFRRVAQGGVASVMSAYNSLNGEWCGDSRALLTDILREEWGWDGFVVTDFLLGLRDPIGSIAAGCNVEMPFAQQRAQVVADAVASGALDLGEVERRVGETMATFLRFSKVFGPGPGREALASAPHRALAREAAVSSMVLLTNEGVLPADAASLGRVAVLGRLAAVPNLGDGGSSNVAHTPDPVTPLAGLRNALPGVEVVHSDDDVRIGNGADLVVVVVGLTRHDEGEYMGEGLTSVLAGLMPPLDHPTLGSDDPATTARLAAAGAPGAGAGFGPEGAGGGDRASLRLSAAEEALIASACAANDRVVVAVIAGSAVVMPWLGDPQAVLMMWYAGSEGGNALADVLFGAEPGGRLPFALPREEGDLVDFDRDAEAVRYGLLHGQWWLDANGVASHLPFGYGRSYAAFRLGEARRHGDRVSVTVTNTARRSGSTVVQVYGSVPGSHYERPRKRLIGFAKVALAGGAAETVDIALDLAQLDVRVGVAWLREELPVELHVGFDADTVSVVREGGEGSRPRAGATAPAG